MYFTWFFVGWFNTHLESNTGVHNQIYMPIRRIIILVKAGLEMSKCIPCNSSSLHKDYPELHFYQHHQKLCMETESVYNKPWPLSASSDQALQALKALRSLWPRTVFFLPTLQATNSSRSTTQAFAKADSKALHPHWLTLLPAQTPSPSRAVYAPTLADLMLYDTHDQVL